jgi:hypothetical protein
VVFDLENLLIINLWLLLDGFDLLFKFIDPKLALGEEVCLAPPDGSEITLSASRG